MEEYHNWKAPESDPMVGRIIRGSEVRPGAETASSRKTEKIRNLFRRGLLAVSAAALFGAGDFAVRSYRDRLQAQEAEEVQADTATRTKPAKAEVEARPEDPVAAKVRELYGPYSPQSELQDYKQPAEGEKPVDSAGQPLKSQPDVVNFIGRRKVVPGSVLGEKRADGWMQTENLDQAFKLSQEDVRKGLDLLPPAWVKYRLAEVTQADHEIPVSKDYGFPEGTKALAVCENCNSPAGEARVIFSPSIDPGEVLGIIPHEAAHANDCWSSPHLNMAERNTCALDLADRVAAPDRFSAGASKSVKNDNAQLKLQLQAREYYAEIIEQFFKDPGKLNVKDARIVTSQLRKGSPRYDPMVQQRRYQENSHYAGEDVFSPHIERSPARPRSHLEVK